LFLKLCVFFVKDLHLLLDKDIQLFKLATIWLYKEDSNSMKKNKIKPVSDKELNLDIVIWMIWEFLIRIISFGLDSELVVLLHCLDTDIHLIFQDQISFSLEGGHLTQVQEGKKIFTLM
jgi:hypothetical protein